MKIAPDQPYYPYIYYLTMLRKRSYPRTQNLLLFVQLCRDLFFAFFGLSIGYWLRFNTALRNVGIDDADVTFASYLPLLILGTILLVGTYAYLKVYDGRLLLRPLKSGITIVKGTLFWFAVFLGTSLALKFEPSVSRLFVALSCVATLTTVSLWRLLFHACLERSPLQHRLVQRVALVGWTPEAHQLVEAINKGETHPYEVVGWLSSNPNSSDSTAASCPRIGELSDLEQLLRTDTIDILIVGDLALDTNEVLRISALCERMYVQFKIVPSFFRIFISNLRLQTISGVPVLGVEELQVTSVVNAATKRIVDIGGAIVGIAVSAPAIAILTFLIRRESPGPVIYRQTRTGRHGVPFTIYKLRSMRLDAEKSGAQWAVASDPRRLKIGAFMREWNLDELPQFWNVLIGDMSLVGPRPERPELIAKFENEIPHYNPRHTVRPGLTGWAQVNGLRGNTSLVDRIKYDLYYIENWSLWFDLQIMVLTFTKNKNAY